MSAPGIGGHGPARTIRLGSLQVICHPGEPQFSAVTAHARAVFRVPYAFVSLAPVFGGWGEAGIPTPSAPCTSSLAPPPLADVVRVVPDTHRARELKADPLVAGAPFIRFYAGHPLALEGRVVGTLGLMDTVPRRLSAARLDTLAQLARWAESELSATVHANTRLALVGERDAARRAALLDPLTGVWNRRGLDELLSRELQRASRRGQQVVLMLLDLDRYKEVNDRHGHIAGDLALTEVARRIRMCLRPHDIVARFGGDEFVAFATDCSADSSTLLAERILAQVGGTPIIARDASFTVSLSIGIACAEATPDVDALAMFGQADAALYEAKMAGGQRALVRDLPARRLASG
ncbi:MAG: sensor domain-containing diguanylate cyclase [Vicinamibacterales bacterium]